MDFDQLRASLRQKGVSATYDPETDQLHMDLPSGADLTPEEQAAVKQFKPQIVALAGGGDKEQITKQDIRRHSAEDPRRIGGYKSPEEMGLAGESEMGKALIGVGGGMTRGAQGIRQMVGAMSPEDQKKWAENFRTLSRAGKISKPVRTGELVGEILPAALAGETLAAPVASGLRGAGALAGLLEAPATAATLEGAGALARMGIPGAIYSGAQFQAPGEEESRLKAGAKGAALTTAAGLGISAAAKGGLAAFDALANRTAQIRRLAALGEEFGTHIPPAELALGEFGQQAVTNTTRKIFPGTLKRTAKEAEVAIKGLPERVAPGASREQVDALFDRIRQIESKIAEKAPAASGDLPRLTSIQPSAQRAAIEAEPELFRSAASRSDDVAQRLKYLKRPEAPGAETGVTVGGPEMVGGRDISRQAEDFAKWRSQRGLLTSAQRLASRQGDDTTVKALGKLIGSGDKDAQAYIESLAAHGDEIGALGQEMQSAYTAGRAGVRARHQRDAIEEILTKASGPLPGSVEPVVSLQKASTSLGKEALRDGSGYTSEQRQILFGAARLAKLGSKGQLQSLNPPTGNRLFQLLALGGVVAHPVAGGAFLAGAGAGRIAFDSPAVSKILIWLARLPENQLVGASGIAVSKAVDRALVPTLKKIGETGIRSSTAGMAYQATQRREKEARQ